MLSIIICTYNREKYLYNVLKSIAENDFSVDEYEIVLVNNNSTDGTEAECGRFRRDFPQVVFRYVVEKNQGLSHARNRGIAEAKGGILIYIDYDALVNKEFLRTYADFFAQYPQASAGGGAILPMYETAEPKWMSHFTKQLITGYLYLGNQIKKFGKGKYPGGGNAGYRKEVFEKIGLFNVDLGRKGENLIGAEEKDIFDKMTAQGMEFYYLPNAVLYHIIPESKLTETYFNRHTFAIGQSERIRTLNISKKKFRARLFSELAKWCATLVLFFAYLLAFQPQKGLKLLAFRKNVTAGLLNLKPQ